MILNQSRVGKGKSNLEMQPTFQGTMHSLKWDVTNGQIKYISCLLFGSAAWKIAPRHDFIGWDADRTKFKLNADCKDFKYKKVFSAALGVNSPP